MPDMTKIEGSSNVASAGYDPDTRELHVTFHSGATYVYEGVPESTYHDLLSTDSVGGFLNRTIKPRHKARRI